MDSQSKVSTLPAIKVSSRETQEFWEIPVAYEDEQLLVLNKPAGLAITASPEEPSRLSLMGLLHQGIASGKPWAKARNISFLMNAHRLDHEASGVLLLAKNKSALTRLLDWFGSQRATLSFITLASGDAPEDQFSIEAKLAPHPVRPGMMRVDPKYGKRAETTFEVIERFQGWVLLKCVPFQNRQHQLQLHLARAGLHMAGDQSYRGKLLWLSRLKPDFHLKPKQTERPLIGHPCLHAARLEATHPQTEQPLVVESPWPKDLQVALKYLRRYAPFME